MRGVRDLRFAICDLRFATERRRSATSAVRSLPSVLLLLLLVAPARAQHDPHKTLLRNGITVITKEVHTSHVLAVNLFVRGGASLDPPEQPGLANFVQRMLLRGTARRSGDQVRAPIEAIGGTLDARAEYDYSLLYTLSSADALDTALDVLADVFRNPRFEPEEIEKERQQILDTLTELDEEPAWIVQESLSGLLYPSGPYAHATPGTPEAVKGIRRADLVAFHRRYYTPENLIVVVVGNIDRAGAEAHVTKVLGDMPRSGRAPVGLPAPAASGLPEARPSLVVKERPGSLAHMGIAFPMDGIRREEYPAIMVMNALLGGGMGSRLMQEARERYGIAYAVTTVYSHRAGGNHLGVYLSFEPIRPVFGLGGPFGTEMVVNKAKEAILGQFDWVRDHPVADRELVRARNFAAGSFVRDHQRTLNQARYLGWFELLGLGYQYDDELPRAIDRVTKEDLRSLARRYFGRYALSLVMPKPTPE
ncbi:MAG: insulinase family protein [Armatimonadetes bacterium]|nr:insulinase family protein [Armatimonadota bacterium]